MAKLNKLKKKLHSKRALTEKKVRQLEEAGQAGERYTATISDINFMIVGLLCDVGWIIHIISEIKYLFEYGIHTGNVPLMIFDILLLTASAAVVFGIAETIYLNIIHEKEIATRMQKNMSFGMTVFGGLAAGIIGIVQLFLMSESNYGEASFIIVIIVGGFVNFIFGLPIFLSFKKGIIYSSDN